MTVSGTSANTLRAAYPYGGGQALAAGIAQARAVAEPHWVVVDGATLERLGAGTTLAVHLYRPVEVFDGTRLSSFPSGTVEVEASQVGPLMAGVARWRGVEPESVRRELAADTLSLLAAHTTNTTGVVTDLTTEQLSGWLARMRPFVSARH